MHHVGRVALGKVAAAAFAATTWASIPPAAIAGTPAYVGTWGSDAANCKVPQEQQGAPMIVSAKGYDQHEAHCTFDRIMRTGRVWNVDAHCSVEGSKQKDSFTLQVNGDKLVMSHGKAAHTYVRCK